MLQQGQLADPERQKGRRLLGQPASNAPDHALGTERPEDRCRRSRMVRCRVLVHQANGIALTV
jgi:hypothetical protein